MQLVCSQPMIALNPFVSDLLLHVAGCEVHGLARRLSQARLLAIREFDMTVVDSSVDEATQQQHGWSDGSSTDTVHEPQPRRCLVLMSGKTHVETRAGSGRRVVLIPASPGSTPQSVQDLQLSAGSNRFTGSGRR